MMDAMDLLKLFGKKKHYHKLRKKWVARHQGAQQQLWSNHGEVFKWAGNNLKHVAATAAGAMIFLTTPVTAIDLPSPYASPAAQEATKDIDKSVFLLANLGKTLPTEVRPLTVEEEKEIGETLSQHYGFNVTAELDGKRLNRSYGLIGAEQHLPRYPGDTMESHFDTAEEATLYARSGMTPGLGAWRYFAPSKEAMTEKEVMQEKYYIAVQTFLAPDFHNRVGEYRDFFKFRKMLVVNPHNGRAVVTVIGDAGPAVWTGKHLGGSPEVMSHLQRVDGRQRGAVLYFFIDDPEDKIPLGPVDVQ